MNADGVGVSTQACLEDGVAESLARKGPESNTVYACTTRETHFLHPERSVSIGIFCLVHTEVMLLGSIKKVIILHCSSICW